MSAIRELREAVEAGTWGADGVAEHPLELGAAGFLAWNAYNGSVDAALALMEAVLPGWPWHVFVDDVGAGATVRQPYSDEAHSALNPNPARALLIAILKAMETQP